MRDTSSSTTHTESFLLVLGDELFPHSPEEPCGAPYYSIAPPPMVVMCEGGGNSLTSAGALFLSSRAMRFFISIFPGQPSEGSHRTAAHPTGTRRTSPDQRRRLKSYKSDKGDLYRTIPRQLPALNTQLPSPSMAAHRLRLHYTPQTTPQKRRRPFSRSIGARLPRPRSYWAEGASFEASVGGSRFHGVHWLWERAQLISNGRGCCPSG